MDNKYTRQTHCGTIRFIYVCVSKANTFLVLDCIFLHSRKPSCIELNFDLSLRSHEFSELDPQCVIDRSAVKRVFCAD